MKTLLLILSFVFCLASQATTIVAYSVGISSTEFEEQGGLIEREDGRSQQQYRVNLEYFEKCTPKKVVAKAMANEEATLSIELENKNGWYVFRVPLGIERGSSVVLQVYCKEGIPLRNVWL